MLMVWMIIGRIVMIKERVIMMMTLTTDLNDGMELIGDLLSMLIGGGGDDSS